MRFGSPGQGGFADGDFLLPIQPASHFWNLFQDPIIELTEEDVSVTVLIGLAPSLRHIQ